MTMVSTPPICCRRSRLSASTPINPNTDAVAATNTAVKPGDEQEGSASHAPRIPRRRSRIW